MSELGTSQTIWIVTIHGSGLIMLGFWLACGIYFARRWGRQAKPAHGAVRDTGHEDKTAAPVLRLHRDGVCAVTEGRVYVECAFCHRWAVPLVDDSCCTFVQCQACGAAKLRGTRKSGVGIAGN